MIKVYCPICYKHWKVILTERTRDSTLCCNDCCEKRKAEMNRGGQPVGGESCTDKQESQMTATYKGSRYKGECGGGRRVIRKSTPMS